MAGMPEEQARVAQAAVSGGTLSAAVTPQFFGSQVAGTMEDLGLALYTKAKRETDQAAARAADRQLSDAQLDLHTRIQTLKGKDAVEQAPALLSKEWKKITDATLKGLGNDEQRLAVAEAAQTRYDQLNKVTQYHVHDQDEKYKDGESEASLKSSMGLTRQHAGDGNLDLVEVEKRTQRGVITELAIRNGTTGSPAYQQALAEQMSHANTETIGGLLQRNRDLTAQQYYADHKDAFTAADRDRVEKLLEEGSLRGTSLRTVTTMAEGNRSLTEGLAEIRKTVTDPKLQDLTIARWKQYHADNEAASNLESDQRYETWHQKIDDRMRGLKPGAVLNPRDIMPVHEWVQLKPEAQASLIAFGQSQVREPDRVTSDRAWMDFVSLSEQARAKLSRQEFEGRFRGKFSNADQRLAETQWKADRDAVAKATAAGAHYNPTTTFSQQVEGAFRTSGLVAADKELGKYSDSEVSAYVKFQKAASAAVEREVVAKGRKLSATEEQTVIDQVKDAASKEYLVSGRLFGTRAVQQGYLTPKQEADATLPMAEVPADWLAVVRGKLGPHAYAKLNAEQLRHAYAQQQLGRDKAARQILMEGSK